MKNIKNKLKDFVRANKSDLKRFAKVAVVTYVACGGFMYALLKEEPRPSMKDLLPEVQENQKLVVDTAYINDFGGLKYILYTDINEDGLYDNYKSVVVGNSPGQYSVDYGERINESY